MWPCWRKCIAGRSRLWGFKRLLPFWVLSQMSVQAAAACYLHSAIRILTLWNHNPWEKKNPPSSGSCLGQVVMFSICDGKDTNTNIIVLTLGPTQFPLQFGMYNTTKPAFIMWWGGSPPISKQKGAWVGGKLAQGILGMARGCAGLPCLCPWCHT